MIQNIDDSNCTDVTTFFMNQEVHFLCIGWHLWTVSIAMEVD